MRAAATELWHQKPGARSARQKPLPPGTKEIVNGLERREILIGAILCAIDFALSLIAYVYAHNSHVAKTHNIAPTLLIAGLIGTALILVGLLFRRRALLGFASFLVGMELLTSGLLPEAVVYIFFGGWLIFRVMRKQKQDQAAGTFTGTVDTGPRPRPLTAPTAPTASKRYTPPRRSAGRAAATRRR
ncbi:MAG: hypothetical protein JWM85_905 [Acidimicrobiaceae bacterium]|nr:hypothetical protein [Acidimicrobiaceae bacterium]